MPDFFALSDQCGVRARLVFACFLCCSSMALAIGPINDTGITGYSNDTQNNLAVEPSTHPGQDARYGRDAATLAGNVSITKTGNGSKAFDFTKISNDGKQLPDSASLGTESGDWACTLDNVSKLVWEVKTTSGLRSLSYGYSWYDSNPATNGGGAGTSSEKSNCFSIGRCDTEKYTQDVNAAKLCGYADWRLPTAKELLGIADLGRKSLPAIDENYFPNTLKAGAYFWASTTYLGNSSRARYVLFDTGEVGDSSRSANIAARLVRGGQ